MGKVKALELQTLQCMSNMLQSAVNKNGKATESSVGVMLPAFMKNLKDKVCKNLSNDEQMPHSMAFYFHLFQCAHNLIFAAAGAKNYN